MPTENTIDILYRRAEQAVNRLSVADNHWTFKRVPGQYAWWCFNHGHKEAILTIEFDNQGRLHFIVLDTGLVRFIDGTYKFEFYMTSNLTDQEEDSFLDRHLVNELNRLHNIYDVED